VIIDTRQIGPTGPAFCSFPSRQPQFYGAKHQNRTF